MNGRLTGTVISSGLASRLDDMGKLVNNDNHNYLKDKEGKPAYPTYSLLTKEQNEKKLSRL